MTSYMRNNGGVELTSHMWTYDILSKNAKLIKYLEDNHVLPSRNDYKLILKESIICHHNDVHHICFFFSIKKKKKERKKIIFLMDKKIISTLNF